MAKCYERSDVAAGLFKIRGETAAAVLDAVSEWRDGPDGPRFESLAVRDCTGAKENDFMVAIDFVYVLNDGVDAERSQAQFFHKYTDLLRRRFGNGLAVWDVSTPLYVVD